jgi:hypothetical protein
MNQPERASQPLDQQVCLAVSKWRPKWTSTHQLTMEAGGWIAYGQEMIFWLYSHPLVMYSSSHASTYLVTAQVPFPLTYLHNNHLHSLPTHLWYTYPPTFIGSYLGWGKGKQEGLQDRSPRQNLGHSVVVQKAFY